MIFKILYDNEAKKGFKSGWGFSCLVGNNILFDVGAERNTLIHNMSNLSIDFEDIDIVVLSHEHGDHIGGIGIINMLGEVDVYVPRSFSREFKNRLRSKKKVEVREVYNKEELYKGIYTTGQLGRLTKEQSLVIKTDNGMIVLTGCSHPGLEKIIKTASSFGEIYGIIGGFHGFSNLNALNDLKLIVSCHCTAKKDEIIAKHPERSKNCAAGTVIDV